MKKMLVIDDMKVNCRHFREVFQNRFEVLEANDGEEGLELLKTNKIAVILLDIVMPKMDGIAFLKELGKEKKYREIPVIAITERLDFQLEALRCGAWDFVAKSTEVEIIEVRVENVLGRSGQLQEQEKVVALKEKVLAYKNKSEKELLDAFQKAYNQSPIAIAVMEIKYDEQKKAKDVEVKFVNEACATLRGFEISEYKGKDFYELFRRNNLKWLDIYESVATTGIPKTITEYSTEVDKYLQIQCYQPVFGYCVSVLTDISKEVEEEKKLKETAFEMNHLVNSIPGGIGIYKMWDGYLEALFVADGVAVLSGMEREEYEEWIKEDAFVVICEEDRERLRQEVLDSIMENRPIDITYRIYHKSGRTVWVHLDGVKMREEEGGPVFHAVFTGVSEVTLLYQEMLDQSSSAVYVCNADTYEMLYMNGKAFELGEIQQRDYMGKKCYEIIMKRDSPCSCCKMSKMKEDSFLIREFTPPHIDIHVSMKGKLIDWNGIKAHIEYITDETAKINAINTLQKQLRKEEVITEYARKLSGTNQVDKPINENLALLGMYYGAESSFIFEVERNSGIGKRKFDWNSGKTPDAKNFERQWEPKDYSLFQEAFLHKQPVLIANTEGMKADCPAEYSFFARTGFSNVRFICFDINEELQGIMGIYNATENEKELDILERINYYLKNAIAKERVEKKLLETTEEMNSILNGVPGAISIFDPEKFPRGLIYISDGWENLTGYTPQEQLEIEQKKEGVSIKNLEGTQAYQHIQNAIAHKGEIDTVLKKFCKDKKQIWLQYKATPIWTNGKILYYGFYRDVTVEKEAQRLQKAKYDEAIANSSIAEPNAIVSFRVNVTKNLVEECKSKGTQTDDLKQYKKVTELFASILPTILVESDQEIVKGFLNQKRLLAAFRQGKTELEMQYRRNLGDGVNRWLRVTIQLTKSPVTEDVIGFIYTYDVHEQMIMKQMIDSVIASDYDFMLYIDGKNNRSKMYSIGGQYNQTRLGQTLNSNKSTEEYLRRHYAGEDLEGFIQKIKLETIIENLNQTGQYIVYYEIKGKNGIVYHKKGIYSYLEKESATICFTSSDVTGIFNMEAEQKENLKHALYLAQQANLAKSKFLSSMSHDLRTPMNAIMGMAEVAKMDIEDTERVQESLSVISSSAKHLLEIINDVLDMSKIESGGFEFSEEKMSLKRTIMEVKSAMTSVTEKKKQTLSVGISIRHDHIIGNPGGFKRILYNLLGNASKFTQEKGIIEVLVTEFPSGNPKQANFRFVVEDNGRGIEESKTEEIFKPFVREGLSAINHIEGTGLGLSIVKNIVEAKGGFVKVESEIGKGSRFIVELPAIIDIAETGYAEIMVETQKNKQRFNFKGLQVLLVEDHPLNVLVARRLLEKQGVMVQIAENGAVGVDVFCNSTENEFDVIFMDVQMPVMGGYQATKEIRESLHPRGKMIPIIAMTANAYVEDIQKSLDAGMNGHIAKPISLEVMGKELEKVLGNRQEKKEE